MERRSRWFSFSLSLAIAGTMLFTFTATAQYGGGCDSCGGDAVYGYPADTSCGSGGCHSGGCGSGCGARGIGAGMFSNAKAHYRHLSDVNRKAFERNRAWPMPFDCADRQIYFSIWDQMLTHGYQLNCVFNETHFDPYTHELNQVGIAKIKSIFRSSPEGQKVAYVQNVGASDVVEARLSNLRNSIGQWYGSDSFTEIAATNVTPSTFIGGRAERLQHLRDAKLAAPVIPVASGTGSTQQAAGN